MIAPLAKHWRFAVGQAFGAIREMTYAFDFVRHADGHTFVGMDPGYLLDVIDGFLSEEPDIVPQGHRTELEAQKETIAMQIVPAYQRGIQDGQNHYEANRPVALSVAELHSAAMKGAPSDQVRRGWYVEGFCVGFCNCETTSMRERQDADRQNGANPA
jgi:hypothetical protein